MKNGREQLVIAAGWEVIKRVRSVAAVGPFPHEGDFLGFWFGETQTFAWPAVASGSGGLIIINGDWVRFVRDGRGNELGARLRRGFGAGIELFLAEGEELFESAIIGAREVGLVTGEVVEVGVTIGEGAGHGAIDFFLSCVWSDIGHVEVDEAGFHAGATVETDLEAGHAFDEGGFGGRGRVKGFEERFKDGREGVEVFTPRGDVGGGEPVLQGVLRGAVFAFGGTRAGGFFGVVAVGPEAGVGSLL